MLKGKTTGLRAIERGDLGQLLKWRNNPDFRKFFREHRELSHTNQENWFQSRVLPADKDIMFAIESLTDGSLLGACGLCHINSLYRSADVSIYIGKDDLYIDTVHAPETVAILIKYAFEELNMHRLYAEIYDIDTAKKAFFPQMGFKLEGRQRDAYWHGGKWIDSLFFSLLSHEYFNA
ncbi:MAG: GNAT family protein [Pseudomonadota bacterium]